MNRQEIREGIKALENQQPKTVADFEFREAEITKLRDIHTARAQKRRPGADASVLDNC